MEGVTFDPKKLKLVDIGLIRPNTWNPKDKNTKEYKTIKEGISKKGLRSPIVVRDLQNGRGYEIIDGEQRWTACKDLGFKKIFIYNEGEMPDKEAKELTIWFEQQVPFNEVSLAKLVTDMAREYDNLELPFNDKQVAEMSELLKFDWEDYKKRQAENAEKTKEGLEATDMATLSVVMMRSQYDVIIKAINHIKSQEGDTSEARALELICADYLAGK